MAYPGKRTGPRRDFKSRDFGDRGGMRPQLHDATCAECGNECQVPFKPNGKKPVLCGNCFKKDGGFSESRDRHAPRMPREEGRGGDQVLIQLKAINQKLDALIDALSRAE